MQYEFRWLILENKEKVLQFRVYQDITVYAAVYGVDFSSVPKKYEWSEWINVPTFVTTMNGNLVEKF